MTFDADAQTVRQTLKRLLRVHTRNVNLADANRRQAATAGSTVGPRTSGGTPGDPTGQQAVAGLKAPGDIAGWQRRLLRELPKLADAGEEILQDHLREASTPTEQCKCRGCPDRAVLGDGRFCERCWRVRRNGAECGPNRHRHWPDRTNRTKQPDTCLCDGAHCDHGYQDCSELREGANADDKPTRSQCRACRGRRDRARAKGQQ